MNQSVSKFSISALNRHCAQSPTCRCQDTSNSIVLAFSVPLTWPSWISQSPLHRRLNNPRARCCTWYPYLLSICVSPGIALWFLQVWNRLAHHWPCIFSLNRVQRSTLCMALLMGTSLQWWLKAVQVRVNFDGEILNVKGFSHDNDLARWICITLLDQFLIV